MSIANKIANASFNEVARATTNSTSRHGPSKATRKGKRILNKGARKNAAKQHFKSQDI